jgi:hypothetical protein
MELVRVPSPFATGVLDCSTKASAVTGAATCISLQSDMGKSQKLVDTSECLLWVPAYCTHTHIQMDLSQHVKMNGHPFHQFYPMVLEKPFFQWPIPFRDISIPFPSHFIPSVARNWGFPMAGEPRFAFPKTGGS